MGQKCHQAPGTMDSPSAPSGAYMGMNIQAEKTTSSKPLPLLLPNPLSSISSAFPRIFLTHPDITTAPWLARLQHDLWAA